MDPLYYSASIIVPKYDEEADRFVYHVVPLGRNYDSRPEAMNAAMAETAVNTDAIGFVITLFVRRADDPFWGHFPPPPKKKS